MTLNLALILVILVAVCGALALLDLLVLAPRRRKVIAAYGKQVAEMDLAILQKLKKEPLLVEYGKSFFPVLFLVLVLRSFLVEPFQIPSGSMIPTLEIGDFIVVNKFAYGIRLPVMDTKIIPIGDPQRGDVMVFRYPSDPSVNYIKRVVGLPGDKIRYTQDKRLYVNDQLVAETPETEELGGIMRYKEKLGEVEHLIRKLPAPSYQKDKEWQVPEGHYFVLGDNRDYSKDSRYWDDPNISPEKLGMVPDANVVGKAFAIWMSWPGDKLRSLPNFSRVGVIR